MIRNVISSTITVPLMSMTPATPARKIIYLTWLRKTNPNARLMKYIASTRPTMVNNQGIILPWASGWRATPLMNALPARPSPTAAPMAPNPRARPKPISAPASVIPWSVMFPPKVFVFESLAGRAKVDDRQQHEDERLDESDEDDIKAFPDNEDQGTDDGGADGAYDRQLES